MATLLLTSLKATCLADTWVGAWAVCLPLPGHFKAPLGGHKFETKSVSQESWLEVLSRLSRGVEWGDLSLRSSTHTCLEHRSAGGCLSGSLP